MEIFLVKPRVLLIFSFLGLLVLQGCVDGRAARTQIEIKAERDAYRLVGPETIYRVSPKRGLGKVRLTPARGFVAGEAFTLTVEYTPEKEPLNPGDAFVIIIPYPFSQPTHVDSDSTLPMRINSRRSQSAGMRNGFARVWSSNPNVSLSLFCDPLQDNSRLGEGWHLIATVRDAPLVAGETLTVSYGNQKYGSPGALTYLAQEYEIASLVYRQIDWKKIAQELDSGNSVRVYQWAQDHALIVDSPRLQVRGAQLAQYVVTAPSLVQAGEAFEFKVVARDRFGNVASACEDRIAFADKEGMILPEDYRFTPEDSGIKSFRAKVQAKRDCSILVSGSGGQAAESNPIRVVSEKLKHRIYWGDLHVHTVESDGIGTVSNAYRYGRDASDLDFGAVTDHLDGVKDVIRRNAEAFNDPGRFVTLNAFEFSGIPEGGGDIILYFKKADQRYETLFPSRRGFGGAVNIDEVARIVDEANQRDILIIPHNHGGDYKEYRKGFASESVRLMEIYSVWGNSEQAEVEVRPYHWGKKPRSLQQALALGYQVGIIASGDDHSGKLGSGTWLRRRKAYQSGLVAAFSESLTRDGLWKALWNRRVYGTTGARIILDFSLNGHPMGQILKASENRSRELKAVVRGTENLKGVYLIKNNQIVYQQGARGSRNTKFTYLDESSFTERDHYYLRVLQEDSELAWSSPIWVLR